MHIRMGNYNPSLTEITMPFLCREKERAREMSSLPKQYDSNSLLTDSALSHNEGTSQTTEYQRDKLPLLEVTTPKYAIPHFINTKEDPQGTQTDIELSGYATPQKETCPIKNPEKLGVQVHNKNVSRSDLLVVPKDSPLIKRNWISRQGSDSLDSESDDPMALVDNLKKAIGELTNAGTKLQHCVEDNVIKHTHIKEQLAKRERELETSREENADLKLCEQELDEYKQKCAKVAETERDMTKYYEARLTDLEDQLKSLSEEKDQADKAHKCEVDNLERKHNEEKADLSYTMQLQSRYCQELEKVIKEKDSKLEDFESLLTKFKERKGEVEQLRETLERKESELQELEKEVQTRANEVEALKLGAELKENKIRELKLSRERENVEKQLKRCQEIRGLVGRLPNVTSQEDMERITKQISDDITKMKAATTRTKSISWR